MNPTARTQDLHVEHLDGEALVYDLTTHETHCLSPDAAAIWAVADGSRDVEQIAEACEQSPEVVLATLERLDALGLMKAGATRRDTLRYTALAVSAAAVSIPVISSLAAPSSAKAASLGGTGASCTDGSQCVNGVCNSGVCL